MLNLKKKFNKEIGKMATERVVRKKYLDKNLPGSFSGLPAFAKTNKYDNEHTIRRILSGIDAYTLHRSVRRKYKTRPTLVFYPYDSFAVDLMEMSRAVKEREKFGFCLLAIDMFSRYWSIVPSSHPTTMSTTDLFICRYLFYHICKRKTAEEILVGLKAVFKQAGVSLNKKKMVCSLRPSPPSSFFFNRDSAISF